MVAQEPAVGHVVVRFAAVQARERETLADFDAFDGAYGHDRVRQPRVELAEYRVAESGRDTGDVELDNAADGIAVFSRIEDRLFHFLGGFWVGAADGIVLDFGIIAGLSFDSGDFDCICVKFHAALPQDLHRYRAGGDACRRLAGGGAAAPAMVAPAVLLVESPVGVARPKQVLDFVVFSRVRIFVVDDKRDGRAGRFSFEDAREDFDFVGFLALRRDFALPGPSALHLLLDRVFGDLDAWMKALDDAAYGPAVTFPEGGNPDDVAVGVGGVATNDEFLVDEVGGKCGQFFGRSVCRVDDAVGEGPHDLVAEGGLFDELLFAAGTFEPRGDTVRRRACPQGVGIGCEIENHGFAAQGPAGFRVHERTAARNDDVPVFGSASDRGALLNLAESFLADGFVDLPKRPRFVGFGVVEFLDGAVGLDGRQFEQFGEGSAERAFAGAFSARNHDIHGVRPPPAPTSCVSASTRATRPPRAARASAKPG